ncbi:MAG: recombinase family protein [Candidatus Nomurabacteria bacterium]|nr:recombinase family protein [Candidatus Nomurabacteria bacterium]
MASGQEEAIIFARVSTARQEKEGLSLKEIQLPDAEKYAKAKELKIVKVFAISETGGNYKTRAKFHEMIKYVKDHKNIKHIIAYRVDRMTRNFADFVLMDELRSNYDKCLHFIEDRLVITKDSRTSETQQWDFKALIAKQYLDRVKEDGNNTKYRKLENGELPWCAPYGYKHYKDTVTKFKTVVSKEPEATIARQIHLRYSTNTYSCLSLCQEINAEYGIKMSKSQIQHILRDKFYIGVMIDRKSKQEYIHHYETFVSEDLFDTNQAILDGRYTVRKHRFAGVPSAYRGLMTCSICGCSITPDPKKKKLKDGTIKHYMLYHCTNGKKQHEGKVKAVNETVLDDAIKGLLKKFELPQDRLEQLKADLNATHDAKNAFYDAQRKQLVGQRTQLSNRKRNAYDKLMDGSITQDIYDENNERYNEEIADIQRQEARLDTADKEYYISISYLLAIIEHAPQLFAVAEVEEKRQIIGLLLSNLKYDGKKLDFTLKKPFDIVFAHAKGSLWLPRSDSN